MKLRSLRDRNKKQREKCSKKNVSTGIMSTGKAKSKCKIILDPYSERTSKHTYPCGR
jgi:hypothetical protein